ncbi:hypothetical protein RvY_18788 [Ramazzottius varieornatus]|uniref:Uncharacterized protein n=1 Tax=Ramazzottius varieornatus TaxID=947166 RepID=A0A1D1W8G6_RAMVA|nr:hypothetical protein RvY_18788 [Ramazzottius varieornatus]
MAKIKSLKSTMVFRKRYIAGEFAIQQNTDISIIYRYGAIRYCRIFYCVIRYELHIDIFDTISTAYFIAKIRSISIRYWYTVSLPALGSMHILHYGQLSPVLFYYSFQNFIVYYDY